MDGAGVDAGERRVVVGLDDSVSARAALRFALEEARREGAMLDVVAVYMSPERFAVLARVPVVLERAEVAVATEAAARAVVDEVLAAERVEHPDLAPPPVAVRAVPGDPGPALATAGDGATRLVVGHRGRGAVATGLLGSVGWWCLRHAHCPLTVVPSGTP
ncbi:universal stress protein [Actinomycetospora rhizophila]|uniref:Universal stress protein n=1 Tax=Actinomycetospora rhizophila TaxID=1416876 RepID=A0ABV9ZGW3_9PSEU